MYRRLMLRHGTSPDEFAMVGNSLRSDVLPVIGIGARAFHVPYAVTWAHEHVNIGADHERTYQTLPNLRALLTSLTE